MNSVWVVAILVLLVNLPFGYWRAGVRKFSFAWFVAVHAPVPLVVGLRILAGLGWQLATFPILGAHISQGSISVGYCDSASNPQHEMRKRRD